MEMLIGGTWQPTASGRAEEVTSPFDGAVIGTVPVAGADDVPRRAGPRRVRRGDLAVHAGLRADADPDAPAPCTSTGPRCGGLTSCPTAA